MRELKILLAGFVVMSLMACQSSSPKTNTEKALANKQQDYDKLLEEWQTLKPGIERLLVIEEELNMLLGELGKLQASLAQQSQPNARAATASSIVTPAMPVQPSVSTSANTINTSINTGRTTSSNGNYALQVASITEPHLLPGVWKQMSNKHPQLLANLEPNFQKIQVKNTDYYRLKVGSFDTMGEANQTCSRLKSAGVSCLVVDYNGSNFSQLIN